MILASTSALPWVLAAAAGGAYVVAAWPGDARRPAATAALTVAWLLHAMLLGLEVSGVARPDGVARLGFGSVLSITVWLVLGVHEVESRFVPLPAVRRALAGAGAMAVFIAWSYPGEWRLNSSHPWAPLHWILGVASYGLFGAAVLHARWLDRAERRMRGGAAAAPHAAGMPLLRLERLTFRFVEAGFAVLSGALALGLLTSDHWRADHKTVFSFLGWFVFAALVMGRRLRGWRGRLATRWLYAGAALLLLGYVGSRFVFEVILGRSASMA